jgi:hypothetical protein
MPITPAQATTPISPRKKVIRLFRGLAGSHLAMIDPASIPVQKRGRPRKFADSAEKHRHYRAVKSKERTERQALADIEAQLDPMSRGMYMTDAPEGKGLLVCGSYDGEKARNVERKHLESLNGKKVRPKCHGNSEDHINRQFGKKIKEETDGTFQNNPKFAIRSNWKITEEKEHIIRDFVRENMEATEPGSSEFSRCKLCDFTFSFISAGVRHFLDEHKKLVRAEIRANQPRKTARKKAERAPFGNLGAAYLNAGKQS